jgi:hypothetical protein
MGGEIKRITPRRAKYWVVSKVNLGWSYHEVVVSGGRVYDAFTGLRKCAISEYKALWQYADAA